MQTLLCNKLIAAVSVSLVISACATGPKQDVNLKAIYDRSAQYHLPDRNPIIVIPGILGSRLVDEASGKVIWGVFRAEYADPGTAEGARLISLPIDSDKRMFEASQNVRPDGVLESLELDLVGFPIKIQAYSGILTTLGAGGYRDEGIGLSSVDYGTDHFTCFQFDYDWRRDVDYNAAALKAFIDEKRAQIQENYEEEFGIVNAEVKFDIAAHSMGGLLTRYFLRYGDAQLPSDGSAPELTWAGAEDVERAILVAPPNAGSLDAVDQLVNGFNTGRPILPHYPPAIIGTFPAVYQLLPRTRHNSVVWDGDIKKPIEDIYDPDLWVKNGWGLASRDEKTDRVLTQILPHIDSKDDRHKIAVKYQKEVLRRAEQFQKAIDIPASPPASVELFLVAGDATPTMKTISVNSKTGKTSVLEKGVGDKTVLRSSALMDEREGGEWKPTVQTPIDWEAVLFLPTEHRTITSNPIFEDNVLYWLLEDPRKNLNQYSSQF